MNGAGLIRRRTFLKDALTLITGTALAQGLSLLAAPLLSRLYRPEDFGVFAVFAFAVAVPGALICGAYEAAIMLPHDDEEARDVTVLALTIACVIAALCILPSLAAPLAARLLRAPELAPWLVFVPLNLLALGLFQALSYWLNRRGDYGGLASARIVQTGLTAGGQAGLGLLQTGPAGLVIGQVVGQTCGAVVLWWRAAARGAALASRRLQPAALASVLVRYRRFPLYTSWGTIVGSAAFQVVPVLMTRQFGSAHAGLYFFGYRLVAAGMQLVTNSVTQVFYQRAADQRKAGQPIGPLVERMVARLGLLCAAGFLVFVLIGDHLFALAFGSVWRPAGDYMAVVLPMFCMQMIAAPVSSVLFLLEQQHVASLVQLALLGGAAGSFLVSGLLHLPPVMALAVYAASQVTIYAAYLLIAMRAAGASPRGVFRGHPPAGA